MISPADINRVVEACKPIIKKLLLKDPVLGRKRMDKHREAAVKLHTERANKSLPHIPFLDLIEQILEREEGIPREAKPGPK